MLQPDFLPDEPARLATLIQLQVLDTPAEARFDRLTHLACQVFGVPISLVSLVDSHRQWFKSIQGLDVAETPRDMSFCAHAILGNELFLVPDTLADVRFADNPLVVGDPHIRFYAGMPIQAPNGQNLGTLCVIDRKPRLFTDADRLALMAIAELVEQELANTFLADALASLRVSDAQLRESEERYRRLYAITSSRHLGMPAQVRALIELGCQTLGLPIGLFGRLVGGRLEVVSAIGPGTDALPGTIVDLAAGASVPVLQVNGPVYLTDVTDCEWQALPGWSGRHLATYLGMAIQGSVQRYGLLCFGAETAPTRQVTVADHAFVTLMAQWIGGEIERIRADKRARAHHGVTRVLAEAQSVAAAGPEILATLGESLGWDVSVLWQWEPLTRRLRCEAMWTTGLPSLQALKGTAVGQRVALEEGVVGQAGEWLAPAWIGDVAAKPGGAWAVMTAAAGLHGNMAFPLCADNILIGVIEFFSTEIEQPDEEILYMLGAIGSQIAQFQERKRIEEANQLFAEIVRNMQSGLLVYQLSDPEDDRTFRLIAMNPMAGRLLHMRTGSMLGRTFDENFPDARSQGFPARMLEMLTTRTSFDFEHLIFDESSADRTLTVALSIKAFAISKERLGITFESILARKLAEGELEGALIIARAATKAKSEFLGNMSHELRTPLNSVIGFSEMLEDGLPGVLNEEQRDFVQTIQRNGRHLLTLINEILDLTKIEAGMLDVIREPLDMARVCREILKRLLPQASKKAITLRGPANDVSFWVLGDGMRIGQVVTNLLSNALKFTPPGGTVVLTIDGTDEAVTVAIRDTGIGIAPEMQEKIFAAFVQVDSSNARQEEGTGLGLHLARQLVELQGGRMSLESALDQGSTFSFSLPAIPASE
ncbi:MAG: GAF domain-containing protein [Candidatus Sericytochromatia bacterium]|nr:GAF domain-containing protein [Candidatus Sericytochromatia bacterium]